MMKPVMMEHKMETHECVIALVMDLSFLKSVEKKMELHTILLHLKLLMESSVLMEEIQHHDLIHKVNNQRYGFENVRTK